MEISGDLVVCLGNPPYERQVIGPGDPRARKGGWVRFGDTATGRPPLMADIIEASRGDRVGVHLKSVFNDYVYFWRWAVWAVCEQRRGPGIVSFLTPASFLRGPGFVGLRQLLRSAFDAVWVLDLEGDHLAARQSSNVFAIRTPVAIAIAARFGEAASPTPARTRYARLEGSKAEKLDALGRIKSLEDLTWHDVPDTHGVAFVPRRRSEYSAWPALTDLFPWQTSGCQMKRTWPIGPTPEVLRQRWVRLLELPAEERHSAFRETRDRSVVSSRRGAPPHCRARSGHGDRCARTLCLQKLRPTVGAGRPAPGRLHAAVVVAERRPTTGFSHQPAHQRAGSGTGGGRCGARSRSRPLPRVVWRTRGHSAVV